MVSAFQASPWAQVPSRERHTLLQLWVGVEPDCSAAWSGDLGGRRGTWEVDIELVHLAGVRVSSGPRDDRLNQGGLLIIAPDGWSSKETGSEFGAARDCAT